MTVRHRWMSGAYAALSAADVALVGLGPRGRRLHHVVKPLLMPTLATTLAARLSGGAAPGSAVRQTLTAQGLSWCGDMALMGTSERRFLAGVGSFLTAHLAYIAALRALGAGPPTASSQSRVVIALASALVPANAAAAGRRDPRLALAVGLYATVLAAMAASAAALPQSRERGRIQAGAALFLLSDSLLGVQLFVRREQSPALGSAVMATYTTAQWLISDGVRRSSSCESAEDGNARPTGAVAHCAQQMG